ncbi:MAG: hypothetical protein KKD44_15030 [Proteobacteria bacterium]|nr:hypothetical protein [Pseudomonadota bacterium]
MLLKKKPAKDSFLSGEKGIDLPELYHQNPVDQVSMKRKNSSAILFMTQKKRRGY